MQISLQPSTRDATKNQLYFSTPRRRITRLNELEANFKMVRQNYEVEAYLRSTLQTLKRYFVVPDTGAEPSCIKAALIPTELQRLIQPVKNHINARDKSDLIVMIACTIFLVVNAGNQASSIVIFSVVEGLGTYVILWCSFFDAHVETICPQVWIIELPEETIVPIIKCSSTCSSTRLLFRVIRN